MLTSVVQKGYNTDFEKRVTLKMAENQNEVKYYADLPKRSSKTNQTLSLDKTIAFLNDGKEACQSV